jgi:hypothetical protein
MTFNVRVYGYTGITQLVQATPRNYAANGPWVLQQPYNWSQLILTNGNNAVSTTVVLSDPSQLIAIEVPDGNIIRYEFNPPGRAGGAVNAGNASPRTSGFMVFPWGSGWTVSIVEQSFFL